MWASGGHSRGCGIYIDYGLIQPRVAWDAIGLMVCAHVVGTIPLDKTESRVGRGAGGLGVKVENVGRTCIKFNMIHPRFISRHNIIVWPSVV